MKAITLLLAAVGGAGFLYRSQLQSLINSSRQGTQDVLHHQAPEGVYYLRMAYMIPTANGDARWSPGQELRVATDTVASHGFIALTDGTNTMEVPQTAVTRDMDDAAALRQMETSNQSVSQLTAQQDAARQAEAVRQAETSRQIEAGRQANLNRIVSGQFHETTLDAPVVRTNRPENIVSTAGAPVIYWNSQTVVIDRRVQPNRAMVNGAVAIPQRSTRPVSTPPPAVVRY